MNQYVSLVIFLPFLEIITGSFARRYKKFHEIVLCLLSIVSLVISIKIPISKELYFIDFGFLKLKFMCDIYSYFFGILINIVWILTNLYSYSYTSLSIHRHKVNQFFRSLSLSIFAVFGICYSGDLLTTFIFATLLTLITSPLITQNGTKESVVARNWYLITHLGSSFVFFAPAIWLIWHYIGSLDFNEMNSLRYLNNDTIASFILFLFVFGISKNCIIPFHHWIIKATVAPTPVSGLLHSVAAVKSGSIIMLKL